MNLEDLKLQYNQIVDFTPLLQLRNLKSIRVAGNPGDFSPILELDVAENWVCLLEDDPIAERLENRSYPSVYQKQSAINLPELSWEEKLSYHDLYYSRRIFNMGWYVAPEGVKLVGDLASAKHERDVLLSYNPNMIFLPVISYQATPADQYPEDWPYWLRDASGNRIQEPGYEDFLIDFTQPGAQDFFVQQAIAVAQCGLYDGIFLDWWVEDRSILYNRAGIEDIDSKYAKIEVDAKLSMLRRIREAVGDEFLILVNTVQYKAPRSAPYVNGTFMETGWDPNIGSYTHEHLTEIEDTLLWSEKNFREPQINCLEAQGIPTENPDSPTNQRWMRVFTTMSLTHSDGYVLYIEGITEKSHYWYDFWDADLGRPVGGDETKGQHYVNTAGEMIEGLFIREFTNGWAVYNRSGTEQTITLPMETTGVASGITATRHTVPDLDGEMYLKQESGTSADVNGDGVVNVLDLVLVAQYLGETGPPNSKVDVNGDGIVNILDLILIAQHLGGEMAAAPAMISGAPDAAVIQAWIEQAQLENDGSIAFQRGIANLQRLLASLIPEKTVLLANYPNPFNPETWIPYHLADPSDVRITIYDTRGSIIQRLELGHQHPGYYVTKNRAAYWDGRNEVGERVANGIYFYQLQADQLSFLRKMVILK